jgi:hypothetical protein
MRLESLARFRATPMTCSIFMSRVRRKPKSEPSHDPKPVGLEAQERDAERPLHIDQDHVDQGDGRGHMLDVLGSGKSKSLKALDFSRRQSGGRARLHRSLRFGRWNGFLALPLGGVPDSLARGSYKE